MDLARFSDISLALNKAISTKKYTFEVWIYSQTYIAGKFGNYSFTWNRYLKVDINSNTPNYVSSCYPLWESTYSSRTTNKQDINFTSDQLPWVYLRCSVNLLTGKYFHFQEKSFISEQTLTSPPTDILSGTASLTFTNATKNRGVLFFRLLRLYDCYDCQTADNYRVNWINVDIIKSQITSNNLLYHVDGKITGYDTIDRTNNDAEQKQKIKYIEDSSGVKESAFLSQVSSSDFLGYNVLDITTTNKYGLLYSPQATNYLCPENTYFCLGLVKLNEVNDIQINSVTPSFTGKYTIEFWTMITSVTTLANGFHIIWKDLGSVTVIRDQNTSSSLNTYCWPQDHKFDSTYKILNTFGNNVHSLFTGTNIINKDKKTRTTNVNNTWLYVRCAVNTVMKKFYSVLEDETTLTIPAESTLTTVSPMAYAFSGSDTTYVLLTGMSTSGNSGCTIYLRNLWLYANYLLPNNNNRHL